MTELDGATLMGDLAAFPSNAGEFAARWNDATPAQRDDLVSRLVGMQQEANRCFEGDHRTQIERLRSQLTPMQRFLMDLDRSPHGRHQGDVEGQDPTGTSQGNPHLTTGQVIGHDIGGRPYIVPEPHLRGDASAWQPPRPQPQVASTGEPEL